MTEEDVQKLWENYYYENEGQPMDEDDYKNGVRTGYSLAEHRIRELEDGLREYFNATDKVISRDDMGPHNAFKKLQELLTSVPDRDKGWVSVDIEPEQDPDEISDYLIYGCKRGNIKEDVAGHHMIAHWNGKVWRDTNNIRDIEDNPDYWYVTHWQPLTTPNPHT